MLSQWVRALAACPGAQHVELPVWEAALSRVSVEALVQFGVSARSSLVGVGQGWGAAGSAVHVSLFCPLLTHMTSPPTSGICIPSSQGEFCMFPTIWTNTSNVKFHLSHFGKYGPGLKLGSWRDSLSWTLCVPSSSSGSSGGWRLKAAVPHPSLRHHGQNGLMSTSLFLNRII